jgi:hypothetical protein
MLTNAFLVQSALWGWATGLTDFGNPFMAVMVDSMHHAELGLFKHQMDLIKSILTPAQKALLDWRVEVVRTKHNLDGCRLPSQPYFSSDYSFFAFEQRAMIQVILIVLQGVTKDARFDFSPAKVEAVRLFVEWFYLVVRATSFQPCRTSATKTATTKYDNALPSVFLTLF